MTVTTTNDLIRLAHQHLTPNQARALELRLLDHTYTEIGLELNITRQAARDRVRSATENLRRKLAHQKDAA
jgi:DNA-directed RNA polymerase specialized sigma24 family protein